MNDTCRLRRVNGFKPLALARRLQWLRSGGLAVNHAPVLGAGHFVPIGVITNERMARAIPGWPAERIEVRTGGCERATRTTARHAVGASTGTASANRGPHGAC